jgi:LysR family transcriptional regulator, transcriptional activator of the cysJI operon
LTLHQLKIFSSIAKCLNVTKASAELHISQPSVSQQAKLLQEEYGAKLYAKNGRGIQLTDEGRLFLKEIEPILRQVDLLKNKFGVRIKEGTLTIGGSHSPSASFLPLLASVFKDAHANTQVTFRTHNSDVLERMVLDSDVEIAVITNSTASPHLVYEPCRQEELLFFASVEHPLAKRKNLSVAELANAPLVVFKKGRLRAFEKVLKQIESHGLHWNVAMYCESADALKAAVKARMGLGLIYRDLVQPELNRKEFKIVQVQGLTMRSESYIIYHKDKPLSVNAKVFLALLRQQTEIMSQVNGSSLM